MQWYDNIPCRELLYLFPGKYDHIVKSPFYNPKVGRTEHSMILATLGMGVYIHQKFYWLVSKIRPLEIHDVKPQSNGKKRSTFSHMQNDAIDNWVSFTLFFFFFKWLIGSFFFFFVHFATMLLLFPLFRFLIFPPPPLPLFFFKKKKKFVRCHQDKVNRKDKWSGADQTTSSRALGEENEEEQKQKMERSGAMTLFEDGSRRQIDEDDKEQDGDEDDDNSDTDNDGNGDEE
ncbi:hypothetical protein RFI_16174, partial [Reticulomyxa filosa]